MSEVRANLTGFGKASNRRLICALVIMACAMVGWAVAGYIGAAVGFVLAVLLVAVPWWGQPVWSWVLLRFQGRSTIEWSDPFTVANNRSGGGVRIDDGVAVVAVQLLGKSHAATTVIGSSSVETDNVVDVAALLPLLDHPLGLQAESLSVVSAGARIGTTGDYPRVYGTLIGTPPYAGRRETWLIMRFRVIDNTAALRWRTTVGASAIAAAQRVAGHLRCEGLRARVATASDMTELDRRLGMASLTAAAQHWKALRTENGWLTTYAYPGEAISSEVLAQAWTLPVDEVIQNLTVFPDGTCAATISVRTPQPFPMPPAVVLRRINGEQGVAAAANMCGPRRHLRGLHPSALPLRLLVELGPSGVLVGKLRNGDRLLVPLTNPGELSRIFVAAEDPIAKRIVIRAAGQGERVCVHTRDHARWASVRMPDVLVSGESRPAPRTTVSVVDGLISPSPRPSTVITVAAPGTEPPKGGFEVSIEQIGPVMVRVTAGSKSWLAEVELFRAENRYCTLESLSTMSVSR